MASRPLGIIAIVVGVLAVVVLILWIVGRRTSVTVAEVTIAASPAQPFAYLTEPEKAKQWMEGVVEIAPFGASGRRVGAQARIVIEEGGSRFEMAEEVIGLENNRLLEVRIASSMFDLTNRYELTENGGKSRLEQTMRTDFKGFVPVNAPLMGGELQRKLDADFGRLQ